MLRVLAEAGLVEVDADTREVLVVSGATSLEGSAAFRAYARRGCGAVEQHLHAPQVRRVAVTHPSVTRPGSRQDCGLC